MITETGLTVQLNVEEEHKPEPRLVLTLLQLMVVQIVLGRRPKLRTVTNTSAQVNINSLFFRHLIPLNLFFLSGVGQIWQTGSASCLKVIDV